MSNGCAGALDRAVNKYTRKIGFYPTCCRFGEEGEVHSIHGWSFICVQRNDQHWYTVEPRRKVRGVSNFSKAEVYRRKKPRQI